VQLWPPVIDPATLTRQVWDAVTARSLPAVGRAMGLYGGLISQCALDYYAGAVPIPRSRMLKLPDPNLRARSTFVRVHVEDYLVHGNALHLVTSRDQNGEPASVRWFPAAMWAIDASYPTRLNYYINGNKVARREDVVHAQWGANEAEPWRGVGIVERYLRSLNRMGLQEASESNALSHGAVPSVAVIAPQNEIDQEDSDLLMDRWEAKFGGPRRRPGLFPKGTVIQPLSFSPSDQEATLARQMSLTDAANMLNLDPYWLGAPGSSHTYKSPGPMFTTMQRTSLEPVMTDLELVWGLSWRSGNEDLRFDRVQLTRDDFGTSVLTIKAAVEARLMTEMEGRVYLGLPPEPALGELREIPTAAPAQAGGKPTLQIVPDDPEEGTGS
jgi:hypothetical protein